MSGPLRIDWADTSLWPGRLGLTFAPGKRGVSLLHPGVTHSRDMAEDFGVLARKGVNVLAPLIEDFEFELLDMGDYHAEAERRGIVLAPCPIPDREVPRDLAAFGALLDELMDALLDGRRVVVHCRGGLGRAGLTAACLLVQGGLGAAEAVALVRRTRPGTIETAEQEEFVHTFETRQGGTP